MEQLPDPSSRWNYTILLKLNISEAYLLLGTHEEGISLIEEYLPQIERHGTDGQLAIAHILISRHYEELGRLVHARRRLSIALEIYRAQGDMKHAGMVRRAMERLEGTEKRP